MKPKTPKELILPVILPPEDQHKLVVSRYYSVNPESQHLGLALSPYYHECNIRIDWGKDGGIYRVEWANVEKEKCTQAD
jgi:hypothetical protein